MKRTAIAAAVLAATGAMAQTSQLYITPDGKRMTLEQYQISTTLSQVGVPAAWSRGYTGKGVKIAVLDQGFGTNTYDIKNAIASYQNFYSGTISSTNAGWGYHGTGMASIVAGRLYNGVGTVGVAPDAMLLLGQVGQGGNMPQIESAAVIRGLNWAGQQGATAVNMSFSATFDSTYVSGTKQIAPGVWQGNTKYGAMYGQSNVLKQYLTSTNTTSVVVAAAGNQGLAYSGFPGAFATATDANGNLLLGGRWLIVGSVDSKNNISSFSNRAGHICTNVVSGVCKDLYQVKDFYVVAPGQNVTVAQDKSSAADYMATFSTGTSPATAVVSGGIALIKQAWPQLKAAEIVQLVKNTATDLGAPGVDEVYGYGLVNFDKATQPYADIKYSKVVLKSGTTATGISINTTGISTSGPTATALGNSAVLKSLQVVDSINRNFTLDATRAIGYSNPANSLYTSPYLAMQGTSYREFALPAGKDTVMTFMQTQTGAAVQVDTAYKDSRVNFQVGSMSEAKGFLNNYGSGLFGMGNSATSYAMVGGSTPVSDTVDLIGSYGLGFTRTNNVQDSLISLSPTMVSDTWKLGFAKKDIFFSGKTRDQLTLAVQAPVSVRKGHADVTGVTGYTYSGADDDVSATPVITTERVNLASGRRQTDLVLGYNVSVGNKTYAGINIARQFNVSGQAGQTGTALGFMVRSVF